MLTENISADVELKDLQEVEQVLSTYKSTMLTTKDLRLDLIQNAYRIKRRVYYARQFPLHLIHKSRQGASVQGIIEIINRILEHYTLGKIEQITQLNTTQMEVVLKEVMVHCPPLILSILPDETIHLDDGNHRVYLAEKVLGLKTLPAFILC